MSQTHFHVAELWRTAYRPLYCEVGDKPLVILVTSGITSIYEKAKFIEKELGCRTLWLSRQLMGMRNLKDQGILACCLQTITKLFNLRSTADNCCAMIVHAAVSHTGVRKLKELLPGIRVISYVYDFMNIFVPEHSINVWEEYHGNKETSRQEYEYLDYICKGELSDAVIFKDGGPDWDHLKDCKVPTMWFPHSFSRTMHQDPPDPRIPDTFILIGTIVPKSTHGKPSGLFDDIMMEDIFHEVSDQGYRIHAYVLNPHPDVIEEYRQHFGHDNLVRLFKGDTLEALLPRVRGRYRWGWMMYHYPKEVVMDMIRVTLPTKFFSYLALGIPPVVSEEKRAVCRFVEKYKCGVIVSQKDILNLRPILDRQDYPELIKNVLRAREELCLEQFLDPLTKFIGDTMKRPAINMEPWNKHESERHQRPAQEAAYARPTAHLGSAATPAAHAHPSAAVPRGAEAVRRAGLRGGSGEHRRAKRGGRNKRGHKGKNRRKRR